MNSFHILKNKINSLESIVEQVKQKKQQEKRIVFTNGCFDIIHKGHLDYLSKARDLGDFLIIGLNSDSSIKKLKGMNRPVIDEESRAFQLAAFFFVDAIVIFNEETPINLIKNISPDILVKGGDYGIDTIVGADFVKENGGSVQVIPFIEGYSTTNIINKIKVM